MKVILDVDNETFSQKYLGMSSDVRCSAYCFLKYVPQRPCMEKSRGLDGAMHFERREEVLIKSAAQAITTCTISFFLELPRDLCLRINSLIWNFWWGSKEGNRKTCWVVWDDMVKPKFFDQWAWFFHFSPTSKISMGNFAG